MGMVVRTNIMAVNANRQLGMNNSAVSKSIEKLSSGFRINRAGDDASGLAISEKMKAQITALEQAASNSQDGISLIQTAEGALTEVHSMLNRMVELSEKSANGTMDDNIDRVSIQKEVDALKSEIDRISKNTNFNGINLLDGSLGMNKDAITVGGSPVAGAGADFMTLAGFGTVLGGTAHVSTANRNQTAPTFSFDFADYEMTGATASETQSFAVTVGGVTTTVTMTGQTSYSADDIATAFVTKFNTATTSAGANEAGTISGMYFKAAANGSKITFSYAGMAAKGTAAAATDEFTQTEANTINTAISNTVGMAVTKGGSGAVESGSIDHASVLVDRAAEKLTGARAGIDLTITAAMIADGNKMTIDGKTFVFKNGANSTTTAGANETLIDLSDDALLSSDTLKIDDAIKQMSNSSSEHFNIEAKNGTTLHIDQKVGNAGGDYKLFDTEDELQDLFSVETNPAKNVGTKVTIDPTKLKSGDSLTIGDKTYTFADSATTPVQDNASRVVLGANGANALANLQTALAENGVQSDVVGNDITIRSTDATATKGPEVYGGGLVLQIGDTSDTFNQISVAVKDMSTKGLNIDSLSVATAADATKALDLVKKGPTSAINQVSLVRADLGAFQNRLEHTINNLDVAAENMTSANSRIRDTDMAKEMMNYTKMNVLTQAAQAMLAQANQQPQAILQLLQ